MSQTPDPNPSGRSRADQIAYAVWAFVLAGLACFALLDAGDPPVRKQPAPPAASP